MWSKSVFQRMVSSCPCRSDKVASALLQSCKPCAATNVKCNCATVACLASATPVHVLHGGSLCWKRSARASSQLSEVRIMWPMSMRTKLDANCVLGSSSSLPVAPELEHRARHCQHGKAHLWMPWGHWESSTPSCSRPTAFLSCSQPQTAIIQRLTVQPRSA